jgi:hypothetical protein
MSDCGEEKAAIEEEDGIPTNQPPSRKETRLRERACLLSESYSDVIIRARAEGAPPIPEAPARTISALLYAGRFSFQGTPRKVT